MLVKTFLSALLLAIAVSAAPVASRESFVLIGLYTVADIFSLAKKCAGEDFAGSDGSTLCSDKSAVAF